jgi:hypothetical protein
MGSNRLSPVDQYNLIKQDAGLLSGDVTLRNYRGPLPFGTTEALNRDAVSPQVLKDLQNAAAANLGGDSDVGRFAVPGYGDQGQFAGAFDPAFSPMGTNRLSPADQAKAIAYDTAIMEGTAPIMPRDRTATIANLRADSDAGRYGVAGIGDLGQFAGGDGSRGLTGNSLQSLEKYNDISASAYAKGGDVQMPQEAGANPFADPNTMAVYDQMRQTVSPKEFGDEMLAGAAQIDPEVMAQFRNELSQIDLSPEDLDMLNNMVDEILANPEQYAAVRAKYLEMGAPEELLPEQFDPQFFSAMNMAVDQLIAEPAGVQAFAQGGIAELKPIAKAIASYGRNGDTMLAHITPAEARMLRRRGGSGTINPATGLPEFFLKKAFMRLGKAVKSFAESTVGKIVLTVALGFFLGPAAAGFMGVTSAAGVAAVGGFVGGAGSTLLAGGNLKQALKAGAVGGLTAGAGAAVGGAMGGTNAFASGSYTGPTTISGQVDRFTNAVSPSATASGIQAPAIDATGQTRGLAPTDVTQAPYKPLEMTGTPSKPFDSYFGSQPPAGPLPGQPGSNVLVGGKPAIPSFSPEFAAGDPGAGFEPYNKVFADAPARVRAPVSFTETPVGANEQVFRAPSSGMADVTTNTARDLTRPSGMADVTTNTARDLTRPADTSYFDQAKNFYNENISPSGIQQQGATDALSTVKSQFPGVTTEQIMSAPANSALGKAYAAAMPGIMSTYGPITAAGIGALALGGGFKSAPAQPSAMRDQLMKPVTQRIAEGGNQRNYYIQGLPGVKYDQYGAPIAGEYAPLQTFNTGLGIESLIPKGYAAGGEVTAGNFDEIAYKIAYPDVAAAIAKGEFENAYQHYEKYGKAEGRTAFNKAETAAAAAVKDTATKEKQATARGTVAAAKAAKKAIGSKSAYENINAGLAFDAPEGYAANARATRQAAFAPTLNKFIKADAANTATLGKAYAPTVVNQPYNNSALYSNVYNPVATPVNYNTTATVAPQGVYTPPAFPTYVPPAFVDNTAARLAAEAAERKRLADIETARLAEIKRLQDAETERLRVAAAAKAASDRAIFQGQSTALQNQQITDYLRANPTATDQTLAKEMDYWGIKAPQVAQVVGMQNLPANSAQSIDARYSQAALANAGDATALAAQAKANAVTDQGIRDYFAKNAGLNDLAAAKYMDANQIDPAQLARAFAGTAGAIDASKVFERYQTATANPAFANQKLLNKGGIATLGTGGYPRRTGQINGPGTATSDSIPAMLSDGEFVMTAKAVRGAGKGDRRAGAKRMYALMNQLEKNAARG